MNGDFAETRLSGARRTTVKIVPLSLLGLMLALALPMWAGERAVQDRVAPTYPEIAKRLRIGGVVRVEATVDPAGKVTDVKSVSGNHLLQPAAEEAVRHWKFASGAGVTTVAVDVSFSLGN